ncbi:glycerol-3-phosphate 1-O-acyltransferase PlsY [Streptococcus cuniculipharyngis]|uniref:Glycerol-3-phosphate acyltransferase n=1 Tax=Streptococcus cuniculipharyngis TaxID=1562651 RepID=A0A5C5SAV0_9STRE|nr:glycerol-3-phosphate 1-O-acyltransferase PlsY [Streptococcus cuniculipharyngis]TWS96889.1 glycerol-3-phosphate 1-O-acyltransferase PlsY [Streptococcus cuniculipharyngis]
MTTLIYLLIAYLLGSIPTGLWIGHSIYGKNLREFGSGNTGTTNTFRILGKKAGTVTLLVDLLKGTLATLLPIWFGGSWLSPIIIGFLAVLGHTFPVFAHFKGGKAVATSAGVILGFAPSFFLYLLVIFLTTLYLTSMISYASISVAICALVGIIIFPALGIILPSYDLVFSVVIGLMATVILLRHQDNMKRIKNKKENLVPFGLNLTKQAPKK